MNSQFNKIFFFIFFLITFLSPCTSIASTKIKPIKTPVIIDTDVGFEDQIAIYYVLRHQDKIKLQAIAISTDGENYCNPGYNYVKAILESFNQSNIPVACGPSKPLKGNNSFPLYIRKEAVDVKAGNLPVKSLTPPNMGASELMYNTINNSKVPVEILEIAPQTNLAKLLLNHPNIKNKIKRVVIMGGAINVPGNVNQVVPKNPNTTAEFNYYVDPYAASIVINSGLNLTIVPVNFTNQIPLNSTFYNLIDDSNNKYYAFIKSILNNRSLYTDMIKGYLSFWDTSAAVVLLNQDQVANCSQQKLSVNTDYSGKFGGTVSVDNKHGANVKVCNSLKVTPKKFYDILLK